MCDMMVDTGKESGYRCKAPASQIHEQGYFICTTCHNILLESPRRLQLPEHHGKKYQDNLIKEIVDMELRDHGAGMYDKNRKFVRLSDHPRFLPPRPIEAAEKLRQSGLY